MTLNQTPTAVAANDYSNYVHDCLRNKACEPSWAAPLPDLARLQVYVNFGPYKPFTVQLYLQDTCDPSHAEQLFASNFVVGKTPEGRWYGVFKYFPEPMVPVTNFVVWLSAEVSAPGGLQERTYFSELLCLEPCETLTKIKACQPEQATNLGFDVNGLYYGLPVNADFLGEGQIRYFHIAYARHTKARALPPKTTFTSNLIRNFRTTVEKGWSLETEFVPAWYADVLLAIYARGALSLDDGTPYLVSDTNFEALNDDDLTWKPFASLKATIRLFFGCDESVCSECCSPTVVRALVNTTGFVTCEESPSASASSAPAACCSPTILSTSQRTVAESSSATTDPDAQAFIDAVGTLDDPQQGAILDLVGALKSAGVWDKLHAAYPVVGGTAAAHKWNLKDPRDLDAAFRLTFSGGFTHSSTGMLPDGASGYADTHLVVNAVLDPASGSIGYYSRTNNNANLAYDMGCCTSGDNDNTIVVCRYMDGNMYLMYGSNTFGATASADGGGLFSTNRLSASDTGWFRNGASVVVRAADAVTLLAESVYICACNHGGGPLYFSQKECAFAFISDGLTDGEQLDLYNAVQAFQTALGRNV